jgi:hypothetical protein
MLRWLRRCFYTREPRRPTFPVAGYRCLWLCIALTLLPGYGVKALVPLPPPTGLFGCINGLGQYVVKPIYTHVDTCDGAIIAVHQGALGGFVDSHGREVLPIKFALQESFNQPAFSHGLEPVGELGHMGYIDDHGVLRIPSKFKSANRFWSSGYALVMVGEDDSLNWKRALIDTHGKFVIQPTNDWFSSLAKNGLYVVSSNGISSFGYMDREGRLRIPERYDKAETFSENGLAAVNLQGKWGFINSEGSFVIPPLYDDASSFDRGDAPATLARVVLNGREMFIDRFGRAVIYLPKGVETWGQFSHGLVAARDVETQQRWGYVDERGQLVIGLNFGSAGVFANNGTAEVYSGGKWGYVDRVGGFKIKPAYDEAGSFARNGLAPVEQGDRWGYIDALGTFVITPQFDSARSFGENGLALVEIDRPQRR